VPLSVRFCSVQPIDAAIFYAMNERFVVEVNAWL
jgi:hypothetical protein